MSSVSDRKHKGVNPHVFRRYASYWRCHLSSWWSVQIWFPKSIHELTFSWKWVSCGLRVCVPNCHAKKSRLTSFWYSREPVPTTWGTISGSQIWCLATCRSFPNFVAGIPEAFTIITLKLSAGRSPKIQCRTSRNTLRGFSKTRCKHTKLSCRLL